MGLEGFDCITKTQQLMDGGLIRSHENSKEGEGALEFLESWSAEYIHQKWLAGLFPHVWRYMERVHQPLSEGDFYCVPLVSYRGHLSEFVKKSPINGSDLEKIKAGKGKRNELSTLYFGKSSHMHDFFCL